MPTLPYGSPQNGNNVPSQELYQLAHYLKVSHLMSQQNDRLKTKYEYLQVYLFWGFHNLKGDICKKIVHYLPTQK